MLSMIAIELYHLREVSLSREHILNPLAIEHKSICRNLETVFFGHAVTEIGEELIRRRAVTPSDYLRRNEFRFCVHCDKHPCIANFVRIINFDVALFLCDEAPNFIGPNVFAV